MRASNIVTIKSSSVVPAKLTILYVPRTSLIDNIPGIYMTSGLDIAVVLCRDTSIKHSIGNRNIQVTLTTSMAWVTVMFYPGSPRSIPL